MAPWSCLSTVCSVWSSHPEPRRTIAGPTTFKFVDTFLLVHLSQLRFCSDILDLDTACSILLVFEIAEIEKVSPLQSLKFAIFLVILIIFISHWAGRIQNPHFRTSADWDLTWRDCVRVPARILRSGDAGDPSQYSARSAYRLSQPNGLLWVSSGGYCWVDQSDIDKSSIITRIRKVLLKNYLPSV